MKYLYLNVPIQNGDFLPDNRPGSILAILTAAALLGREDRSDERVDLWNNVLAREEHGHTKETYLAQQSDRLETKYKSDILREVPPPIDTLKDNDEEFAGWLQSIVARSLTRGTVYLAKRDVHICDNCDAGLALAEAPLTKGCQTCVSFGTHIGGRDTLLTKVDSHAMQYFAELTRGNGANVRPELGYGQEIMMNKRRLIGVSLEQFGFDADVLDPKIGLLPLALFALEKRGYSQGHLLVGRSSMTKNLIFPMALLGKDYLKYPRLQMVPIARAPVNYIRYLFDEGIVSRQQYAKIFTTTLPDVLIKMRHPLSPETLERVIFSRRLNNGIANN